MGWIHADDDRSPFVGGPERRDLQKEAAEKAKREAAAALVAAEVEAMPAVGNASDFVRIVREASGSKIVPFAVGKLVRSEGGKLLVVRALGDFLERVAAFSLADAESQIAKEAADEEALLQRMRKHRSF